MDLAWEDPVEQLLAAGAGLLAHDLDRALSGACWAGTRTPTPNSLAPHAPRSQKDLPEGLATDAFVRCAGRAGAGDHVA